MGWVQQIDTWCLKNDKLRRQHNFDKMEGQTVYSIQPANDRNWIKQQIKESTLIYVQ